MTTENERQQIQATAKQATAEQTTAEQTTAKTNNQYRDPSLRSG
jgi:hypothetical protein